jgi:hypothetical protein
MHILNVCTHLTYTYSYRYIGDLGGGAATFAWRRCDDLAKTSMTGEANHLAPADGGGGGGGGDKAIESGVVSERERGTQAVFEKGDLVSLAATDVC